MATPPSILRRTAEYFGFAAPSNVVQMTNTLPGDEAPIREASPEDDSVGPMTDRLFSRAGVLAWLPTQWLDALADNDDPILQRDPSAGAKIYDLLLDDDIAMSAMQQRRLAITSRDWDVKAGDENDPRSKQAAEDFKAMLENVGFDRVTGGLHWGFWFGYQPAEAMWTMKNHNGRMIVWLDDVVIPDRRWFGFNQRGELRFLGTINGGIAGADVPENKFCTLRTGATHDFAFYGLGLAHWCYWPIFFKRAALKFWALYLEKYGLPTVGIEFQNSDDATKQANLLAAAVSVGQDSAVAFPEGVLTNKRVQILEAARSGAGASSYKDFVGENNDAILRIVLGQPGTSKGVSSGLNSNQADVHADVKAEIVKADSDLISEALNRTFAKWVTLWNYGPDVAPPKVFRVLEDAEDLTAVADRDATLAGIGIKRTKESVAEVYGDGYELAPTLPKAGAKQIAAALGGEIDPETGTVIPSMIKPANDVAAKNAKNAAQFAARFGIEDAAPLYVSRKLLNARDVIAWAKDAGFTSLEPAEELHVTVLYSKTAVDWFAMGSSDWTGDSDGGITVKPGGPRAVVQFGDADDPNGAIVLRFISPDIQWRHDSMIEAGASSDFPEYKPHVTFSYDRGDVDLASVEPYGGELHFGPEIFAPIRTSTDPNALAFSAEEEAAIDRLIERLVDDTNPIFDVMGEELRKQLQGVTTLEGARVALLNAMERLPIDRLARLTALPLLAERAAASIGRENEVTA